MKTAKEITQEVRKVRERVKGFSGYWIGEAAAAIQALEWTIDKRKESPSEDIGKTGGEHERIAAGLTKAVEKTPASPARKAAPSKSPAPRAVAREGVRGGGKKAAGGGGGGSSSSTSTSASAGTRRRA